MNGKNRRTNFFLYAIVLNGRERTASGYQRLSIRPFIDVLWLRFVQSCWITQGKHDRPINVFGHFSDDVFREGLWSG